MNTLKMPEKPIPDGGGESLKLFQLTTAGIKEKSSKDFGLPVHFLLVTIFNGIADL
jgi:hypothetical protein